ncbi:hypothetical protein [Halorussus amylolyticus]|uniref:hypothetical protein n=1 Tax=Halorussus amylolyticus TaxID=1126242 RepID=UPI00104D75FB|nr:hypothetical protein [Halorussus amylolyticus]
MAESAYLASALVTGLLLLAVWTVVARGPNWRHNDASTGEVGDLAGRDRTVRLTQSPAMWTAAFLVAAFVAGGGAVLIVSDGALAGTLAAGIAGNATILVGVFVALLLGYLLWGTYHSARFRGLHSAYAALLSAWVFGTLFVVVVAVNLVLGG